MDRVSEVWRNPTKMNLGRMKRILTDKLGMSIKMENGESMCGIVAFLLEKVFEWLQVKLVKVLDSTYQRLKRLCRKYLMI